jgi:hypothetical protein
MIREQRPGAGAALMAGAKVLWGSREKRGTRDRAPSEYFRSAVPLFRSGGIGV